MTAFAARASCPQVRSLALSAGVACGVVSDRQACFLSGADRCGVRITQRRTTGGTGDSPARIPTGPAVAGAFDGLANCLPRTI
ncbi:hypothetical protein CVV72_10360 [Amycolatopsis sp. TNS106]|nr:hypothetical protein CVV72_10360 [Amycolatopsis sp. TNS106]